MNGRALAACWSCGDRAAGGTLLLDPRAGQPAVCIVCASPAPSEQRCGSCTRPPPLPGAQTRAVGTRETLLCQECAALYDAAPPDPRLTGRFAPRML